MKQKTKNTFGYVRVATCAPEVKVADVSHNVAVLTIVAKEVSSQGARFCVFPELSITGYSCADLFLQPQLLNAAYDGLLEFAHATASLKTVFVVGLPLEIEGRLYDAAAVVCGGKVHGFSLKTYLPNNQEFYEKRWFTPATMLKTKSICIDEREIPVGNDLLFCFEECKEIIFGVEICEDLWSMLPPSNEMAIAGAMLILNPSGSNEVLGKKRYRKELVVQQSARILSAYAYAGAGAGESSTDTVFSGHLLISENGKALTEDISFSLGTRYAIADIDLEYLRHERLQHASFSSVQRHNEFRTIVIDEPIFEENEIPERLLRSISTTPFVPQDEKLLAQNCADIFEIQTAALAKRINHTGVKSLVVGVSGGLDSTLALLVANNVFKKLNLPKKGIIAVTMPGPGTSARTRNNAEMLIDELGCSKRSISINQAITSHLEDIGHPKDLHDVTFENAQARERTQILMNIANQNRSFVLGTGDLSEIALGWCTYNGDHMSMYHINAGVPKTLVRSLVEWAAETIFDGSIRETLLDVAATPISPELLPVKADGSIAQETEKSVGPYILHDFFLYYFVRQGATPLKIRYLAEQAFSDTYDRETITHWLKVFIRRFFSQQFKRSAMPDGPKIGSVALSPRADWRMPSDASPEVWLKGLE